MSDKTEWSSMDGTVILNESGIENAELMPYLQANPEIATLTRWAQGISSPTTREGGLFERDKYVTPWNIYDQMRVAYDAIESDDVVSGVLESTESMAFGGMSIACEDMDVEDVLNQILDDIDLESRLREMWRELFTVSQVNFVVWTGRKTYKVRGRTKGGVQRKKVFKNLNVPLGISILDPMKIIPIGNLLFNQEKLAYIASPGEAQQFERVLSEGLTDDTVVQNLIVGKYEPAEHERVRISQLGVPTTQLFILNPQYVFRHTATKPQYQRFSAVRLRSIFELLDLKHQLRASDRAHLLGSANFILVVKKGTEKWPANAQEVSALAGQVRTVAQVPIIVGDHRLSVEIVTPKLDMTLDSGKYATINSAISARLYQMFTVGSVAHSSGGRDDSLKLARVVARGMESRRHMLEKTVEKTVLKPIYDLNSEITEIPDLVFHPKRIALDFDPAVAQFLQALRDRGDLSRESILNELDFDQVVEARYREREAQLYDDVFEQPYAVPFSAPPNSGNPSQNPKTAGATQGGNQKGGGAAGGQKGQGKPNKDSTTSPPKKD